MTITEDERRRLVGLEEDDVSSVERPGKSRVAASLMGMLAALGMMALLAAILTAAALLLEIELGLVTGGDVQELSVIGFVLTAIVVSTSLVIGGYVAGRVAGHGGLIGIGVSLWMTLVALVFTGLALWVGAVSDDFVGLDVADSLNGIADVGLSNTALIVLAGLIVVGVIGGLLGGRLGGLEESEDTNLVVDVRDGREPQVESDGFSGQQPEKVLRVDDSVESSTRSTVLG